MSTHEAHDERTEMLSAYLDGELTDAELARIEAELDGDASLRAELDALAGARDFLGQHGMIAAPPDFLASVLAAVDEEPVVQLSWYRRPFGVPVEALAVAAAALLVIWVALPSGGPDASPAFEKAPAAGAPVSSSYGGAEQDGAADAEQPAPEETEDAVAVAEPYGVDAAMNRMEPDDADVDATVAPSKGAGSGEVWSKGASKKATAKEMWDAGPASKEAEARRAAAEAMAKAEAEAKARKADEARKAEESARKIAPAPAPEGTSFARVPYSYTLHTDDPQVLYRLASLAARHRGELTDAAKAPLQVEELTSTDAATVLVQIPAHALQAFAKEIGALGSITTTTDNSMFAGDPVEVRVAVRLAAGPPGTGDDEPANAARSKRSYDAEISTPAESSSPDGAGESL